MQDGTVQQEYKLFVGQLPKEISDQEVRNPAPKPSVLKRNRTLSPIARGEPPQALTKFGRPVAVSLPVSRQCLRLFVSLHALRAAVYAQSVWCHLLHFLIPQEANRCGTVESVFTP